ncbi:MAG: hypothetical protein LBH28_04770, partial [Oscillospiraceae bacterium]|nr:hypothetical protein [Oscillospiraceae bacterium]
SDKYELAAPDTESGGRMGMSIAFVGGGRASALPGSLVRYTSQMTNYGAFAADNLILLQLTMDRSGSEMAPFPGLAPGAWRPTTIAGISSDTKVEGFAVELLKTMLSADVQRMNYGAGLPVTRNGVAGQIQDINDRMSEFDRNLFDIDIDAAINKLAAPSASDTALTDMMMGTVEKLCLGKTDVEGAAKEIEQNVKNYLAERG